MRSRRFRPERARQPDEPDSRLPAASLLFLGLVVGLVGALIYAWLVNPVIYVQASPSRLSADYKAEYILLVSQSFAADGDWERASRRLAALDDANVAQTVSTQLEAYLRSGRSAAVMRNLALLARELGVNNPAVAVFVPTEAVASPTATPPSGLEVTPTLVPTTEPTRQATSSPLPSLTPSPRPSPTPVPVFRLLSQERVCQRSAPAPRIEVVVVDAFLEPLPGVEVIIQWDGGRDHFFTGFKPSHGLGYGDFQMSPDVSYSAVLAGGSPTISGLRLEPCDEDEGGLAGGWRLTFQNTKVLQETVTPSVTAAGSSGN